MKCHGIGDDLRALPMCMAFKKIIIGAKPQRDNRQASGYDQQQDWQALPEPSRGMPKMLHYLHPQPHTT